MGVFAKVGVVWGGGGISRLALLAHSFPPKLILPGMIRNQCCTILGAMLHGYQTLQ